MTAVLRVEALDIARRAPVGHLVCAGNVVGWIADVIANRLALGPNELAEHVWPVSAEYDPAIGTTVAFSYLPPSRAAAA